ncbi:hypothetical protein Zmor_002620 [Zophobas morio]|uniref:Uncharacterized protein n=1 Tax=Zophobas morio TaxID=2755281 RepID=A0AA38MQ95_9CUCU|nr:hypothetical protein Zmor_002620 [Zophobas morio]
MQKSSTEERSILKKFSGIRRSELEVSSKAQSSAPRYHAVSIPLLVSKFQTFSSLCIWCAFSRKFPFYSRQGMKRERSHCPDYSIERICTQQAPQTRVKVQRCNIPGPVPDTLRASVTFAL